MLVRQQKAKTVAEPERIDPRVVRTRQLLQQAFNELLAEKDFQSITVQDITERASINRATFYAHFEDKYALLNYTVREGLVAALVRNFPKRRAFTLDNLRIISITIFEFLGRVVGPCLPVARRDQHILIASQVQRHLNEIILQWIACTQSEISESSAEYAARLVSWAIFGAALEWARSDRKELPEHAVDQVLAFLAPSLESFQTTG